MGKTESPFALRSTFGVNIVDLWPESATINRCNQIEGEVGNLADSLRRLEQKLYVALKPAEIVRDEAKDGDTNEPTLLDRHLAIIHSQVVQCQRIVESLCERIDL